MRREAWSTVLLLLALGCASLSAPAQNSAQQSVSVVVLNVLPQPPQPVRAVRVSLSYLDSSVLITDAQQVTNSQGQALLLVSPGVSQRGDLRIEVTGAGDLVIYQPADGQLPALALSINVSMLPKGSSALLGPAQIEAMLHRSLLEINNLQKQISTLKQNAATAQNQKPDLGPALAAWAQANGFSAAQVDQQVQIWAQNIQLQSARATAEQKALAEVALKHYASAAQLFNRAADTDSEELNAEEAEQQALQNTLRTHLRQLISDREQAASAYQLSLQYHMATQTLESAEAAAAAEYKKHPDDKGFHELWLQALLATANARSKEGDVSPARESLPLLAQSADDFRSLGRQYADLGDRPGGAAAQANLGTALALEGARTSGDKAIALLDEAVQAYQNALQVYTRRDFPREWADTQDSLGNALMDEGERAGGDKAIALLDQAVQALQQALRVYTKADRPQDWAVLQNDLGNALLKEGERAGGDKAIALLDQAVQAFQQSLEVRTKAEFPEGWARIQNNLGAALEAEGARVGGGKAAALFDQAVQAYQKVLEVFTKANLPQYWARTQNNLGNALLEEGECAGGDKAAALFDRAVQAYQNALDVFTKADLPQYWAWTQNNLGAALEAEAEHTSGDRSVALFDQAVRAYQKILEVYTKADLPQDWARTQYNLGYALLAEGELADGDKAATLLDQAVQAYRNALEVQTKADLPQDWARTHGSLEEADFAAARFDNCIQESGILTNDTLTSSYRVVRDTLKLACQWGAGDKGAAQATEKALLSEAPMVQEGPWDSTGAVHFLSTSPAFEKGRASWIALFTSVQNGDSAGFTAALHQLEPLMQN